MVFDQSLWDAHQYSAEDKIDRHDLNMLKTEHIELKAPEKTINATDTINALINEE